MGVGVREYGDLTPRELMLIVEEYNDRLQRNREEALTTAYRAAYLQRVKRMPPLKRLLEDIRPKMPQQPSLQTQKQQTPEQMFATVKRLQAKLSKEERNRGRR